MWEWLFFSFLNSKYVSKTCCEVRMVRLSAKSGCPALGSNDYRCSSEPVSIQISILWIFNKKKTTLSPCLNILYFCLNFSSSFSRPNVNSNILNMLHLELLSLLLLTNCINAVNTFAWTYYAEYITRMHQCPVNILNSINFKERSYKWK